MIFRFPTWVAPACVLLFLLSGVVAIQQWKARISANAVAAQKGLEADSAGAKAKADSAVAAQVLSENNALRAQLNTVRRADSIKVERAGRIVAETRVRAAQAGEDLLATLVVLAEQVPVPLVPVVQTGIDQLHALESQYALVDRAHEAQILGLRGMLSVADSTSALFQRDALAERRAATTAREALAKEAELRRYWQREATPPWHVKAWRALPSTVVLVTVVIGVDALLR
jgi:hypothetical protein